MALAIGVIAVLTGCGGGGSESSTGTGSSSPTTSPSSTTSTSGGSTSDSRGPIGVGLKPADARRAVEAVLTSSDPAEACGRYVTEHYLRVAYGDRQGCIQAQSPGGVAKSLRSFRIVNLGTQATVAIVRAVPSGGPYDGTKVVLKLLSDGPHHYRVDALRANVPVGP